MLSPGKYHHLMSREPERNLRQRRALLLAARRSPAVRRALVLMCRDDILFYVNAFVYQHDPSKAGAWASGPFVTWLRQEELVVARPQTHADLGEYDRGILWCIENNKTMACEKSRWQGASWLFLIVMAWHCGFHASRDWICVSRNADAVDDGTKQSLFWKLRYVIGLQPDWLCGPVATSKLYLHFSRSDSEITGEASTGRAGVGGRGSAMFVDEFPEIEKGQEVREKTALTANCRFFVGTHLGAGTPFDKLCDRAASPEVVHQRLHWTDGAPEQRAGMYRADPSREGAIEVLDKQYAFPLDYEFVVDGRPSGGHRPGVRSVWYDRKCREVGDARAVAQNLDIDVAGSAVQFFDAVHTRRLIAAAREPVWEGEVECEADGTFTGISRRPGGRLRLWVRPDGFDKLPAARYTAGADIAGGTGATNSCYTAINADLALVVLEWADPRSDEKQFAGVCVALCRWLADAAEGGAYFGWDSSGQTGSRFTNAMAAIGYGNIYYNEDDLYRFSGSTKARRPGWYGTNTQRYNALKEYRNALESNKLIDRSERCLRETLRFAYDRRTGEVKHAEEGRTDDPSGARQNHGDLVISRIIAWMLARDTVGGRTAKVVVGGPRPGTMEWLVALQEGHRQLQEQEW